VFYPTNKGEVNMKKIQSGFTLIELMIVVAIIGILAAVAIPAYQDYIVRAKLAKLQSTIDPIKLAIGLYYQENGSFPGGNAATTSAQVTAANTNTATTDAYFVSLGWEKFPAIPSEVSAMDIATVNGTSMTITLTPINVKAGTCNTTITAPTSAAAIDACPLVLTATPGSTAINWVYTGSTMGNIIASKFFK
jgi:type IV pilus assembly protein PilA